MRRISNLGALLTVLLTAGAVLAGEVYWSYQGETGPENWGRLSEEFSACASGRMQSPIDISGTVAGGAGKVVFDGQATALDIINNGYTVQVNVVPGNEAFLADKTYDLLQFHFHAPSEHTVSGRSAAMEVHFVYRNKVGEFAVVGVLIEAGAANSALAMIVRHMPTGEGAEKIPDVTVNGADLLPSSAFTTYSGSFTTPPCSEGVTWFVMKDRITASQEQIATLQAVMPRNARPTQPLNGRLTLSSD